MTLTTNSEIAVKQKNIEKASRAKNPMEQLPEFTKYVSKQNNVEYRVYCKAKADMPAKTLKWAFKLAEKNVSGFYKKLQMGWQPKVKQNDMGKNWARYLVVEDKAGNALGYTMFRFDFDFEYSVLYCYELQIEADSQRQGIGKFLMTALEACAKHWQLEKVVLTVLNNNDNAKAFFRSLGYAEDDTSPEDGDYEILSKSCM